MALHEGHTLPPPPSRAGLLTPPSDGNCLQRPGKVPLLVNSLVVVTTPQDPAQELPSPKHHHASPPRRSGLRFGSAGPSAHLHYVTDHLCVCVCSDTQSCLTLCDPSGLQPVRLLCPWDSPDKNTGVGCHAALQGSFPTRGSNPCLLRLLHCRQVLYH